MNLFYFFLIFFFFSFSSLFVSSQSPVTPLGNGNSIVNQLSYGTRTLWNSSVTVPNGFDAIFQIASLTAWTRAPTSKNYNSAFFHWQSAINQRGGVVSLTGVRYYINITYIEVGTSDSNAKTVVTNLLNGFYGSIPSVVFAGIGATFPSVYSLLEENSILFLHATAGDAFFRCLGIYKDPDCIARGIPDNKRHYRWGFGGFPRTALLYGNHMSLLSLNGGKSLAVITELDATSIGILQGLVTSGTANGISVTEISAGNTSTTNFAKGIDLCTKLASMDPQPDGVYIASSAVSTCQNILNACKSLNFIPKLIGVGSCHFSTPLLATVADMKYVTGVSFYSIKSRGADRVDSFLYPPTSNLSSTQLWSDDFKSMFGFAPDRNEAIGGVLCHSLMYALMQTGDIGSATSSALRQQVQLLYQPSPFGLLSYEIFGSWAPTNVLMIQWDYQQSDNTPIWNIVAPVESQNQKLVYPMPTFDERIYVEPSTSYPSSEDRVITALTTICILYLLIVGILLFTSRESKIMKASTWSFCLLIVLGSIVMLSANYAWASFQTNSSCAAHVWLVSLGFHLIFAPLFMKTYRLFKIFEARILQVKVVTSEQLWAGVGVAILIEISFLIAWLLSSGMDVIMIVPDPLRPSLNETSCNLSNTWTWVSFGLKSAILLVGCVFAMLSRNLPPMFNETKLIANSMYLVVLAVIIVIPILASNSIDQKTRALVRGFAIMLVTVGTTSILMLPKLEDKFKLFESVQKSSFVTSRTWDTKSSGGASSRDQEKLNTSENNTSAVSMEETGNKNQL